MTLSSLQQISPCERAAYLLDQPTIAKVSKIDDQNNRNEVLVSQA
jgi:hypothetical protein